MPAAKRSNKKWRRTMRRLEGFVVSCLVVLSAAAELGTSPAWQQSPMQPQGAGRGSPGIDGCVRHQQDAGGTAARCEQFAKMV